MSKVKDLLKRLLRFMLLALGWFVLVSFLLVLVYRWVPVPFTPLMVIRVTEAAFDGKDHEVQKEWKPLASISPHLHLAVVASEDQNFLRHYGIDIGAIEKAMKENETRRRPRGASTISQQTAKNVFLWPGSDYLRKGLEVYFTFLIELVWGKERILEVYLNIAEMGDGVYGAEAASKKCFGVSAGRLSVSQAAILASILPSPRKYSCTKPGKYVRGRQAQVMKQMRLFGGKLRWDRRK